jgi:hypothetical protein
VEDIEEILGIEKYDEEIAEKTRYFLLSDLFPVLFPALCISVPWGTRDIGDTKSPNIH